jgi:carboxyl-terminal processing protease
MRDRDKFVVVSFSTALALVLLFGALRGQESDASKEPYRPLAVLSEVLARIQSDYVEDANFGKVTEGALHGLIESLDPYSSYLPPEEYQNYQKREKKEGSLGMVVSKRFGFVSIVATVPNGPADRAGLQASDVIESIDGKSSREMSIAEVTGKLAGDPGTTIKLAVVRERAGDPKPFELTREVVRLPDVTDKIVAPGIGYLRVEALPSGETPKIKARIEELRRDGAAKFILDLRDNASGEMSEGVATANLFLRRGLIGYLMGQQHPREDFLADPSKAVADEPVAVLVNNSTGGAAEVVASAILESHRGDVVGERTFGIGSVQKIIPLDDGSALLLSVAKYYSPSGKQIQETGVTPNIVVEQERELVPLPEPGQAAPPRSQTPPNPSDDAPLQRAIEVLSGQSRPQAA